MSLPCHNTAQTRSHSPCPAPPLSPQYTDRRWAARARPWPLVCALPGEPGSGGGQAQAGSGLRLRRPSVRSFVCRRGRTPSDVVVRHITFNPRALSTTTSTSFLVITGLTSPLTNHYLPVIAPISSYPTSPSHSPAIHCFPPFLFPLLVLFVTQHTYTHNPPSATAISPTDVVCEHLSDHGVHNAESKKLHSPRQERARSQISSRAASVQCTRPAASRCWRQPGRTTNCTSHQRAKCRSSQASTGVRLTCARLLRRCSRQPRSCRQSWPCGCRCRGRQAEARAPAERVRQLGT